ncbi:glycoside hydrolase family 38 protein [Favolaschia claudopus]|uniref:Glycoside hydrolase family 38 protein n=1 Tax=Favolaschia claudopus TaxID=2862362 RepID=A0AAW0BMF0_9AGAR
MNGHHSHSTHTQAYQSLARHPQQRPQHSQVSQSHAHPHPQSQNSQIKEYPTLNPSSGAKWIKPLTQARISQFNGGHFGDVNLGAVLYERKEDSEKYVKLEVWSAPGLTKPSFAEAMQQERFVWAELDESWWKVTLKLPENEFKQYERVTFEFDPGCEAMIFDVDGDARITGGYGGDRRVEYIIPTSARKKGEHKIEGGGIGPPDPNRYFRLDMADIVVPNQEAWRLLWDFTTLRELVDTLPGNTPLQNAALSAANAIMNAFDYRDPSSIKRAREIAQGIFGKDWDKVDGGAGVYDGADEEGDEKGGVWFGGLDSACHIDTAWLWPYSVDLMERYEEHRFACSQAQQYKWLEEQYPSLFKRISHQIAAGKFHPIGGAWVEHDANMPSGEALVRQMVYGQRYFESRWGWLPDSFGLTGALPQLMRGAGMKYFFTQKLSWNNMRAVGDVNRAVAGHKNLESSDTSLLVFGNGDGGGGPFAEDLRRIRAVTNTHRELPPFFDYLDKSSARGGRLPNWKGELYLEFHRGTYTSHGSIKKGNRHSEILLRDVEHVATLASLAGKKKYVYPKKTLDEAWEKVLLNQCAGMVYDDAEKLYDEMLDDALDVILGGHTRLPSSAWALDQLVAYNTTFFPRREVVQAPLGTQVAQLDGNVGYVVVHCAGGARPAVLEAPPVTEAWGFTPCTPTARDHFVLRNASVQLTISNGRITSLLDVQLGSSKKAPPAASSSSKTARTTGDAWDVEIHHLEKATQLEFAKVSVVAHGPLRASVKAEVVYGQSKINVTISLDAVPASTKLDSRSMFRFDAWVDWRQRHEFLKFELPLALNSDNATYETQFGWVQRPTHKNTTWDMAKFEVCGHKYADLSEYGYGVALLSESKYGFACQGNILRISLLRAATEPDAEQDQGEHTFSWAVLPHKGHFLESDVPTAAYLFNSPLYRKPPTSPSVLLPPGVTARDLNTSHSPFTLVGAPNVFIETVKRGEEDSYKSGGTTSVAQLRIAQGLGVEAAYETNLLEDVQEGSVRPLLNDVEHELGLNLSFRGFEVKTIVLILGEKKTKTDKRESWVTVDS